MGFQSTVFRVIKKKKKKERKRRSRRRRRRRRKLVENRRPLLQACGVGTAATRRPSLTVSGKRAGKDRRVSLRATAARMLAGAATCTINLSNHEISWRIVKLIGHPDLMEYPLKGPVQRQAYDHQPSLQDRIDQFQTPWQTLRIHGSVKENLNSEIGGSDGSEMQGSVSTESF